MHCEKRRRECWLDRKVGGGLRDSACFFLPAREQQDSGFWLLIEEHMTMTTIAWYAWSQAGQYRLLNRCGAEQHVPPDT